MRSVMRSACMLPRASLDIRAEPLGPYRAAGSKECIEVVLLQSFVSAPDRRLSFSEPTVSLEDAYGAVGMKGCSLEVVVWGHGLALVDFESES